MYTAKFGTFLGNNERERKEMKLAENTVSIWTVVLQQKQRFLNEQYSPVDEVIQSIPLTEHTNLIEWRQYFNYWSFFG
jgi:hypothetical protein